METLLLTALPLYGHIRWKRKININISSLQVMSYIFFFIKHNTPTSCFTIFITSLCPHQPWKPALDLLRGLITAIELVVIHNHEEPKPLKNLDSQVCEICGDEIGLTVDGDLFLAFPVCRPCYEYERREGTQVCPQCRTRYKRLKGSPRVEGDDDEEVIDDIEHEFNIDEKQNKNKQVHVADMLHGKMSYGRGPETDEKFCSS